LQSLDKPFESFFFFRKNNTGKYFTFGCFHLHSNPSIFPAFPCNSLKASALIQQFQDGNNYCFDNKNGHITLSDHPMFALAWKGFQLPPAGKNHKKNFHPR
jgi:hypothetical protein